MLCGRGKEGQSKDPRYWPVGWSLHLEAFSLPESEALFSILDCSQQFQTRPCALVLLTYCAVLGKLL